MKAFITGSHAYGKPHDRSDVDLVLRVDDETRTKLVSLLHPGITDDDYSEGVLQFKVASLNLILCVTDEQYAQWLIGTQELCALAPVTRDFAVQTFKRIFGKPEQLPAAPEAPQLLSQNPEF